MRTTASILDQINIRRFAKYVVFNTSDIKPEVETKARKGLSYFEKIVSEMLSQNMYTYALRLEDTATLVGSSYREVRSNIKRALKIGQEDYDGTYGRPEDITPERAIYITTALIIQEYGRKTDDLIEYVVRYHIGDFLDFGALESEYDMACYVYLIEYLERCLTFGKIPITKDLKENRNNMVSSKRIMSFIRKNYWYGSYKDAESLGFNCATPKLSEVANTLFEVAESIRDITKDIHEEYELHKAFDC